jgi:hypothetical protein
MRVKPLNIDNSKKIAAPVFLVEAKDYTLGCEKVTYFLDNTAQVTYEDITNDRDLSCSASDPKFWKMVGNGLEKNSQSVIGLIRDLEESGYNQLTELAEMKQGYESKTLHILVHFLDGFIGIDSSFYNLMEDSHLLSDSLRQKIKQTPNHYWLLQINARNLWTFL